MSAENYSYGETDSEKCDYCGAEFNVHKIKQAAHNEREEYYCPECGKEFHTRASMPIITVVLIQNRTDGRNNKFVESGG